MITVDRKTVMQIFGSLMSEPDLLSDVDKYHIEPSEFSYSLDRYIYSAIYNLYAGGAQKIRTLDIDNYLSKNELAKKLIEEENGIAFLQDCENYCEVGNFNYYYGRFKKFSLLRELQKGGTNIDEFYCEDPLNSNYTKINDEFEKLTTADIINRLKGNISHLENIYTNNTVVEESNAYTGVRELIGSLRTKPEVGIKLQGDAFNTITRGGRKGKLYLRSAGSGIGKALPNYTIIPTPNGWKTVSEIKVGDYLFDRLGNPTKVLAIYPQENKKEIYKVYFKSGRIAECCEEHLWSYYSNLNNRNPNKLLTATTKEILNNPKGLRNNKSSYRWSIPICKPVQYEKKYYSIPPYIMGLILGDGSFRYNDTQKGFFFSSSDEELVKAIQLAMNYKLYKKSSDKNYNWSFELNENNNIHKNVWVEDILKDYPELWQTKSETKFIPSDFLFGSIEQRFDLLAGLLDTDGSIDNKGRINYTTISPFLRDNVIELCESLGMTCSIIIDKRSKYTTGECYTIHIQAEKQDKLKMFKLKRKLNKAIDYMNNNKRTERRDRDSIINIEATGIYTEMTCFYVDNPEHLFLMNNYICTHNTRSMVGDACNIAYPIRYEPRYGKWISTGAAEPVLYIMTEQDPAEIQTMILAYLTGFNEEIFLYGMYDDNDMERINIALDIMERYKDNMLFARIPDPCASVVKNLFRRYSFQHGIENFFYDYIFSSPAMLEEYRDLKLPEYVCLRMFTTALKNLAIELNAFIMTSTQVSNDDSKDGGFKDFRNIQGAKQIVNLVDFGCIMSRPSNEELQEVSGFQKLFNFSPNCVTDVFKNRRGRWTMVRIWSMHDLGTCRKYDLFVTTYDNKPIEEFQIVDFSLKKTKEMEELEELYNNGVVTEEHYEELLDKISKDYPIEANITNDLLEAYGDKKERRQQMSNKSLSDFFD